MTSGEPRRRVAITGIGVVNAELVGASSMLSARLAAAATPVEAGVAAARPGADTAVRPKLEGLVEETEARRLSRVCQLTVAAARLALADAGLDASPDVGLVVGTEFGDLTSTIAFADGYLARGPVGLSPLLFPNTVMNVMTATTAIAVTAREAALTLNAPLVAGELAVARAAAAVAGGRLDAVVAGGVDEMEPLTARTLSELAVTDARAEGAAFLVLEALESAHARGAQVLGEIMAAAWGALPSVPHGVGRMHQSAVIGRALAAADLSASEVGWVYAPRGGDPARERWEHAVLTRGLAGHRPPIVSLSGLLGQHSGLGPLHVAAAAWTARVGRLPVAIDGRDTAESTKGPGLVHGLARGGTHVALVVGPPEEDASR